MSKIYYKLLGKKLNFKRNPTIRYTKTDNCFTINTLDYNDEVFVDYKVSESDLKRMIRVDTDERELCFKEVLKEIEQCDLDDDTYSSVSACQYYFTLSNRVLLLAKRKAHLKRLGKVNKSVLELKPHVFHSKGGRKKGSKNKVDAERIEYLRTNYDAIVENCFKHDWFEEYREVNKEVGIKKSYKDYIKERNKYLDIA